MHLTFIRPSNGPIIEDYKLDDGAMEPLSLAILGGMTPESWEMKLYDDRLEPVPYDAPTDLVAITSDTFTARRAYDIAGEYKKRGVPVVLGGFHPTLLPDEAEHFANAVVVGDAEPVWTEILKDFSNGKLRQRYVGNSVHPQDGVTPLRELFAGKRYLPISLVQFSRGCPFYCSYCSIAQYFHRQHHCRDVEDVMEEIRSGSLRVVLFADDNMTAQPSRAKELFRKLKSLGIKWACQASIDIAKDPELLELMAESGCLGQLIGFEAIDPNELKWLNRSTHLRSFDAYHEAVERLRAFGFLTWASFILGGDYDTPASIERTVRFAIDSKFTLAFFHLLMPYPGTELYAQLASENRLLFGGRWWTSRDFRYNHSTFVPRSMSPDELSQLTVWANREFYSVRSIAKRCGDLKTHLRSPSQFLTFAQFNYLIRKTST